jgi:hypothetical protein
MTWLQAQGLFQRKEWKPEPPARRFEEVLKEEYKPLANLYNENHPDFKRMFEFFWNPDLPESIKKDFRQDFLRSCRERADLGRNEENGYLERDGLAVGYVVLPYKISIEFRGRDPFWFGKVSFDYEGDWWDMEYHE